MGRILHFSDVHFGVEHKDAAAAALAFAHDTPRDLVLVTGDVTQSGRRREFEPAAAWLKAMPGPVFLTTGNHDTPYYDLVARVFYPWRRFERIMGHPAIDHEFQAEGLAVRGVNTARGWQARTNWSKGVIDLGQTRRAADALAAAPKGALRVLACHHPLIEMIGTPMTGDVKRGRPAAEIFAARGVDLIMTGHVHVPFALPVSLGDHCSYAVGAGTLSLRERGMPASFNQIDWDAEVVEVTAMAWAGSKFEPYRTWRLPRRRSASGDPVPTMTEVREGPQVARS